MIKNAKAKGIRAERRTMKHLESLGWHCIRSAASRSPFDILAFHRDFGFLFVQVKVNRGFLDVEREIFERFEVPKGSVKQLWIWRDRQREPRIINF